MTGGRGREGGAPHALEAWRCVPRHIGAWRRRCCGAEPSAAPPPLGARARNTPPTPPAWAPNSHCTAHCSPDAPSQALPTPQFRRSAPRAPSTPPAQPQSGIHSPCPPPKPGRPRRGRAWSRRCCGTATTPPALAAQGPPSWRPPSSWPGRSAPCTRGARRSSCRRLVTRARWTLGQVNKGGQVGSKGGFGGRGCWCALCRELPAASLPP